MRAGGGGGGALPGNDGGAADGGPADAVPSPPVSSWFVIGPASRAPALA